MKKAELLSWLQGKYAEWEELLAQIGEERMDRGGVNGDWSMKDIVAHLTAWNGYLVARLGAAQRGAGAPAPPWPAQIEAEDDINGWIYEANRHRSARDVLDETHRVHQQLLAVIAGFPDDVRVERIEPAYHLVWVGDERFNVGEFFDHFKDDHEPDVRAWLARGAQP
jgi:hypothetical protein